MTALSALISYLPMFGLLVLALTATRRGWPWPLRFAAARGMAARGGPADGSLEFVARLVEPEEW
jgi:hypothetical protein